VTTTLRGERVTLRPLEESDRPRVVEILEEPEVARWFGTGSAEESADEFISDPEVTGFAIEADGMLVGVIGYHEEDTPDYRHAGMDLFLATESQNQGLGLGRQALSLLARHLFEDRGHHRLVIDPAASNARAIRAYETVGFKPVGVMRLYERGPDWTFHDGLLMDLLPEELR
jgi:aminoglycoside 6'-N-acetyltransferase